MNIIIGKNIHDSLQEHVIDTIEFGSTLKGENDKNSDRDFIHIIKTADWWMTLPVSNQHLLQYKTENEDHIYCNPHIFFKCLIDADTNIFYEIQKYGGLKNTSLQFLEKYNFMHYKTIRSYLGIGRRDMKDVKKLWKTKDFRKINKKLKFTLNAIEIVINELSLKCNKSDIDKLKNDLKLSNMTFIKDVSNVDYHQFAEQVSTYEEKIDKLRIFVNKKVEQKELNKSISNDDFLEIIKELNHTKVFSNIFEDVQEEITMLYYKSYLD